MPPTMSFTVGTSPPALELEPVFELEQAVRLSPSARAQTIEPVRVRFNMAGTSFCWGSAGWGMRSGGCTKGCGSDGRGLGGAGGRQESSRCSSLVISHSAVSAMTAITNIVANTPLGSKLFWAVLMTSPSPLWAPSTSPTRAPTMAKPKAVCRLAMIQVSAEGTTTWRTTCIGEAPSTRALARMLRSTSRTPWKALKKTTKNTSTAASSTLGVSPMPNATTKIEPSTIRGMAFTILMYGPNTSARNRFWPSATPRTMPATEPKMNPNSASRRVVSIWTQ